MGVYAIGPCAGDLKVRWQHQQGKQDQQGGHIKDMETGKCLTAVPPNTVIGRDCGEGRADQMWVWSEYKS